MISNLYKRYKGGNRDYCSIFSAIFEISNLLIVFVRMILGKVEVDRFTGPRREIDIRYEFGLKIILKDLRCKSVSNINLNNFSFYSHS